MSAVPPILASLTQALAFQPIGNRAGNVTAGRGSLDGKAVHVALIENKLASGAIGTVEAKRLVALLSIAAKDKSPLVVFVDSAGAKVSEGLAALGAFRKLFRAGLDAGIAGVPVAAVLGRNAYGGSSMLAHLARHRLFSPETQLAMSGPSVLASAAGTNALDEMFKAMAVASLAAPTRAKANPANEVWSPGTDMQAWLRGALAPPPTGLNPLHQQHKTLGERLARAATPAQAYKRKELERLFPEGYEAQDAEGLITGEGRRNGKTEALLGLVSRKPVGAARAWQFAHHAWRLAAKRVTHAHVLLDCESHAPSLEDEKIVLSEFIVDMSLALTALRVSGAHVEMTILDRAGGGVYVALAAPATHVSVLYGAHVQVLPGAAIAAILGEDTTEPDPAKIGPECVAAGVADSHVKLGIIETL